MSGHGKTARELAVLLGSVVGANVADRVLTRVSGIGAAAGEAVVFAQDAATLQAALSSAAGLILAAADAEDRGDPRVLKVRHPKYAFAEVARALAREETTELVHVAAHVDPSAKLGVGTRVGAGAVIEANVRVGSHCSIGSNATICAGAVLGDRVVVQAGAVLGSTGFGYARNPDTGEYLLFPQQGTLVIEDDVEIGANTTVDRGALGETRIGRGTKIDNLVHIAHNCSVGRDVVIAAQVGMSGSCVIEDGVVLAGQVGLGDHCHVGKGVIMGGQSGLYPGKTLNGPGELFAGTPVQPVREHMKSLARLRRLK